MKTIITILLAFLLTGCDIIIEPVLDSRYRVSGTYSVTEYSEYYRSTTSYQITITHGFGSTVYIDNFYGAGLNVTGTVIGNQIDIYRQVRGGYEIQGVATVESSTLRMNYSVRDTYARTTDFCNSTAARY